MPTENRPVGGHDLGIEFPETNQRLMALMESKPPTGGYLIITKVRMEGEDQGPRGPVLELTPLAF